MHNGSYLIKVGSYEIPLSYIRRGTYKCSPAQRQDNDSYVDADGYLHRNPMPHTRCKIEFELITLRDSQLREVIDGIRSNYTSWVERKVSCYYYDDEADEYYTGDFYLPGTIEFTRLDKNTYDQVRLAFIEY